MKRLFTLLIGLSLWQPGFSQKFTYNFKIESVTDPGNAKYAIEEIRDLLGVRIVRFMDETDEFEILTHLEWEVDEMAYDFSTIGFVLIGIITKTNVE